MAFLAFLEQLPPIEALRLSRWSYAAVNGSHILGIACLVGSIIAADLRVIFARAGGDWRAAITPLLWLARAGFILVVATGALMFATRATEYVSNPAFQLKMGLLAAALANVLMFHLVLPRRVALNGRRRSASLAGRSAIGVPPGAGTVRQEPSRPAAALRLSAALSLVLWISVLFCGRMIAFFD